MPDPERILVGLEAIANGALGIAVAWHVVLAAGLLALAAGWRPSQRRASLLLLTPLLSVAAAAFAFGNPFNAAVFAVAALALWLLSLGMPPEPVARGGTWTLLAGAAMVAFGWLYPHFLQGRDPALYLVAAPVGLVPCPTLAVVIGAALLAGGLGTRAWRLTLATLALFYGVFGVARLGVLLDSGLLLGAAALLVTTRSPSRKPPVAETHEPPPETASALPLPRELG